MRECGCRFGIDGALAARQKSIEHLRGYIEKLVPADAPIQPGIDFRSRTLAWEYAARFAGLDTEVGRVAAGYSADLMRRALDRPGRICAERVIASS